jgi:nicotinate phosphoribosyltransferase
MSIIKSLLENDLYKFSMAQVVLHKFPEAIVEYEFKCRNKGTDLIPLIPEIQKELDALCLLTFTEYELNYLKTIRFLKSDFIEFLRIFRLNRHHITVFNDNGVMAINIKGPWWATIFFEIPVLAIVNELYFMKYWKANVYKEGESRLAKKIELIKNFQGEFKFSDFGLRRRFSGTWQEYIVETLAKELPNNFTGTSNVYLANKFNLTGIGTMAHEALMAMQAYVRVADSQKFFLDTWVQEFRGDLGIALSDVVGMDAFLRDFDLFFCKLYDGARHDSGDAYNWCQKLIDHYKKMGIDPKTKTAVFSDGLTFPKAIDLARTFNDKIKTSFGIGTDLTNDLGPEALQIVIKMTRCNGKPVAKISDSPGKLMCKDDEYVKYLMHVFNIKK